jgi:porin
MNVILMKSKLKIFNWEITGNVLVLVFCILISFILSHSMSFAQEYHVKSNKKEIIGQVIELKLPDNRNFFIISNQNPSKDEEFLSLPSFEQATIRNYAASDLRGLRKKMAQKGVYLIVNYMNNNFQKLNGGKNPENNLVAQGLTSVAVGVNTEKLMNWKGGQIYALFQNSTGSSIDQDYVGDIQAINNFDTRPVTLITEYWLRQSFLNDKLKVKIGKQDAIFDLTTIAPNSAFMNSALSASRTIPIPTFPSTTGGISALINPNNVVMYRVGWFRSPSPTKSTEITELLSSKAHLTITEIDIIPKKYLKGRYIIGYWHNNAEIDNLRNSGKLNSNQGIYAGINPIIYKENKIKDDTQGLSLIGQFGWAPQDRNPVTKTYALGLSYQGLISGRDKDIVGIGTGFALSSKYIERAKAETAIETFYLFQVRPWLFIQPDFQIVFHPGGIYKNACVLSVRTVITL